MTTIMTTLLLAFQPILKYYVRILLGVNSMDLASTILLIAGILDGNDHVPKGKRFRKAPVTNRYLQSVA